MVDLVPVLILASIAIFALLRLIPGDPAAVIAGPDAPVETIEVLRTELGLDRALPVQYGLWLKEVVQGNLGTSYLTNQPVTDLIWQRLPATAELAIAAYGIMLIAGLTMGVLAALNRGSKVDWAFTALNTVALSVPSFWTGTLFLLYLGLRLEWFPLSGRVPPTEDFRDSLMHLVLPATTLAIAMTPELFWFVRNSVLEVLGHDYVRTARSKGLSEPSVIRGHVLRNALIPVLTILGVQAGRLLGGAVVVESIFSWPGIGRLLLQSILSRDYPTVQGVLLFIVTLFVLVNLVTDLLYTVVDPRIS
jgi:ABC-type dipeptide/oligopeptide/nickel transport system permease component